MIVRLAHFTRILCILFISSLVISACVKDSDVLALDSTSDETKIEPRQDTDGLSNDFDPNPFNSDSDGDGIPDGMDVDVDGDGVDDNGTDTDGDGINDASDIDETGGIDSDNDGIDDSALDPTDNDDDNLQDGLDPNPNDSDTDDDGIADGADVDADGDGVNDNGTDSNNDGVKDNSDDDISRDFVGGTIAFTQSGPVGGGYPNVVTWDPNVPGRLYYGSDIGGTGRSMNYGKDFEAAARGLGYEASHQKIAALNAVDVNGSTVIVGGTGFKGTGGEVISSSDGGESWVHDSSNISFSAQNSSEPLPTGRPRSTDVSLIQWLGASKWVAGTYNKGVWISTDDRISWRRLNVFSGAVYIRSMAMSPDDANTVYVGLWGDNTSIPNKGLWKISNLNGTPSANKVQGIPDVVESMVVLGNRLYLACGRFGVRRLVPSNDNLSNITGPIGTSVMATAIHGVGRAWNTDRIVVGTAEGDGNIWVSENSGSSFTNTTASGVTTKPWGGSKNLMVFQKHGTWALGGAQCDIASVQVSPHNPDAWVVCSTSAIWTTVDAGTTWRPANGFQILSFRDVEISPTGVIAAGNVDHDVVVSNDGGTQWSSIGFGKVTVGTGLTFSPDGTELAFANSERDNNKKGGKWGVAKSPETPSSPDIVEIDNPVSPKRIIGLTWVVLPNGTERLISAVDNGGILTADRKNGTWSNTAIRTTAFMGSQDNKGLRCSVVSNGSSTTFVYDRNSGVWRTTNYGEDWIRISTTKAGEDTGYLAYDGAKDLLYVSKPGQVLRIDNASTNTVISNLSFPTNAPGALTLDPYGRLLVFARPVNVSTSDTALYRNEKPETGQHTWIDIADSSLKRVVPPITDIDASAEYIVLVTAGKGMLVSQNDAP